MYVCMYVCGCAEIGGRVFRVAPLSRAAAAALCFRSNQSRTTSHIAAPACACMCVYTGVAEAAAANEDDDDDDDDNDDDARRLERIQLCQPACCLNLRV